MIFKPRRPHIIRNAFFSKVILYLYLILCSVLFGCTSTVSNNDGDRESGQEDDDHVQVLERDPYFENVRWGGFIIDASLEETRVVYERILGDMEKVRYTKKPADTKVDFLINGVRVDQELTDWSGDVSFHMDRILSSTKAARAILKQNPVELTISYSSAKESTTIPLSEMMESYRVLPLDGGNGIGGIGTDEEYWAKVTEQLSSELKSNKARDHICRSLTQTQMEYLNCHFEERLLDTAFGEAQYFGEKNEDGHLQGDVVLEWPDGRTFVGKGRYTLTNEASLTGRMKYPDGRTYVGGVLDDETTGTLYDSNENVIYSGSFKGGKPDGWGMQSGNNGNFKPARFDSGEPIPNPIEKEAERALIREEADQRAQLDEELGKPARQSNDIMNQKRKQKAGIEERIKRKTRLSDQCSCHFPKAVCLVDNSWRYGKTDEELEAAKKRREAVNEICDKYVSRVLSGEAPSMDDLESQLDEANAEYKAARKAAREAKRAYERAKKEQFRRARRSRERRHQQKMEEIRKEREKEIEEERKLCSKYASSGGAYPCGCGPFLSKQRRDEFNYCTK